MSKTKTTGRIVIATAILLMALTNATILFSKGETDGEEVILVCTTSTNAEGIPRAPAFNPFSAHLLSQSIVLGSSTPCGLVNVTLFSSAGDFFTTDFDTSEGAVLIPVSGNAGSYTHLLTMPSGAQYVGRFEI